MSTPSLKLPEDVKRAVAAAKRKGVTPHAQALADLGRLTAFLQ